jgi:tetratricopeptide (TPR) repeat protein
MRNFAFALAASLALVCPAFADEGHHHEDLTTEQLGAVHFPVSCAPASQKTFEKGVALLHSFWYEEARKTFEGLEKADPKCAMAYWGHGMSLWHQLWDHPKDATRKQGAADVKKAQKLKPQTERERDYVAALGAFCTGKGTHEERARAYSNAMAKVYEKYPEDHEAAAFYGLSLLAAGPENDTTFADRKKAAAVLEKVFAVEPNHPGVAHYLIHSYDKPQLAELGLPAARRYAQIAPAAPHALHMPSHIFARVGMWQEDIESNLASIAATRKTAAMHMGGASHQFHAMDFLVYAYLQSGREAEAMKVIEEVKSMPPMKMEGMDDDEHAFAMAKYPAMVAMEMHQWVDAAALKPVVGGSKGDNSITYWARAIGAARCGKVDQAKSDIAEMKKIEAAFASEGKKYLAEYVGMARMEAEAWVLHAEGKNDESVATLRKVADQEDAEGPEQTFMPAREMLADMLLEVKRPQEALAEYELALKFNPNRFDGLYGAAQAAEAGGQREQASGYYAQMLRTCAGSNSTRPELSRAKELVAKK